MFNIAQKIAEVGMLEREIHDLTGHIDFIIKELKSQENPYGTEHIHICLRDKLSTLNISQLNKVTEQRELLRDLVKLSDSELEEVIEYMNGKEHG